MLLRGADERHVVWRGLLMLEFINEYISSWSFCTLSNWSTVRSTISSRLPSGGRHARTSMDRFKMSCNSWVISSWREWPSWSKAFDSSSNPVMGAGSNPVSRTCPRDRDPSEAMMAGRAHGGATTRASKIKSLGCDRVNPSLSTSGHAMRMLWACRALKEAATPRQYSRSSSLSNVVSGGQEAEMPVGVRAYNGCGAPQCTHFLRNLHVVCTLANRCFPSASGAVVRLTRAQKKQMERSALSVTSTNPMW